MSHNKKIEHEKIELKTMDIAALIGIRKQSVHDHLHLGRLKGVQRGARRLWHVPLQDFLDFVQKYNYKVDEELLEKLLEKK